MPYQTSFLPQLETDTALDERAILINDPRWTETLQELEKAKYTSIDTEFYEANKGPWGKAKDIDYWKSAIRLIQVGLPSERVLVFNLGGLLDDREHLLSVHKPAIDILRKVVESKTVPKIGMNLSCEYLLLRIHLGMKARCLRDVMLLSQIYWAGVGSKNGFFGQMGYVKQPRLKHSMAAIAERLKIPVDKAEQQSDWAAKHLTNSQISYAARDAIVPIKIFQKLGPLLKEEGLLKSAMIECAAQPAFCECSFNGLPVDMEQARTDLATWEKVRDTFYKPFHDLFPGVNPSSPKQVAEVLGKALDVYTCSSCGTEYDPLQQEPKGQPLSALGDDWRCSCGAEKNAFNRVGRRAFVNAKGGPTTADDVLAQYSSVWYVNALLEGRSTSTCMNWLKTAVEYARDEGDGYRIRTNFKQIAGAEEEAGKGMGRSSASKPINTQNSSNLQPSHEKLGAPSVRRSIKPPPGMSFIVSDLSQAHARIACQWSQDPVMLKDFNSGVDFHLTMTFKLLVQKGYDLTYEQTKEILANKNHEMFKELKNRRLGSKSTNYAKLNLAGVATLKRQMETMSTPVFMEDHEILELIEVWNEVYEVLYQAQRTHIKHVNSYSHSFAHLGLEGEYGESRSLQGRRLFMIKEWRPPRQWPEGNWSKGSWSVKATDAVSSVWMMTEALIIKEAGALILEDFDKNEKTWKAIFCNMAHDEWNFLCSTEYALEVATCVQKRMQEAMRLGGVTDIPVDEPGAKAESLIKADWSAK